MQSTLVFTSLFAVLAAASPLNSLQSRGTVAIAGYDYAGCYSEATNTRAFSDKSYYDDGMTIEKCAVACSGYVWFGTEYGRECYCGSTPNAGSVQVQEAYCSFSCPGDSTETCGAGGYLTAYAQNGVLTSTPSAPSTYGSLGCYTEGSVSRALTGAAFADDTMTVELCASKCTGFALFGLEYQRECYCGDALTAGSFLTLQVNCKYSCMGNKSESCGGDSALNLYQFGAASVPPPSTTTLYARQGCYTEGSGTRALTGNTYFDDAMTIEACATACTGYMWFGVEYGRECYCGNSINQGSVITADSNCNFPCPGNSSEHCGAGDYLDMYKFGASSSTSSSSSILSSTSTKSSSSTKASSTSSTKSSTSSTTSLTTSTKSFSSSTKSSSSSSTKASSTSSSTKASSSSSSTKISSSSSSSSSMASSSSSSTVSSSSSTVPNTSSSSSSASSSFSTVPNTSSSSSSASSSSSTVPNTSSSSSSVSSSSSTIFSTTSTTSSIPTPTATTFYASLSSGGYLGIYTSSNLQYAKHVDDISAAAQLTLQPNGHLYYGAYLAQGQGTSGAVLQLFFAVPNVSSVRYPYVCSITDGALSCYCVANNGIFGLRTNGFIYYGISTALGGTSIPVVSIAPV